MQRVAYSIQRHGGQFAMTDGLSGPLFQLRGWFALGSSRPASLTLGGIGQGPWPVSGRGPQTIRGPSRIQTVVPKPCSSSSPGFRSPPTRGPCCAPPALELARAESSKPMPQSWRSLSGNATLVLKHEPLENSI